MAPLKPVKKDGSAGKLQAITDKAKEVATTLRNREAAPEKLEAELETLIKRPFPRSATLSSDLSVLDSLGCEIWNAATNIIRAADPSKGANSQSDGSPRIAIVFRTFAFLLVDVAYQSSSKRQKAQEKLIRTFKLGLKACRYCLDNNELDLALQLLERCAEYVSAAEEESPVVKITKATDTSTEHSALKSLVSEFYLLRMTHAWRSKRLDIAEQFYSNLIRTRLDTSLNLAEKAADLLNEVGKSLTKQRLPKPAAKWLKRALDALNLGDAENLSQDALELRLSISAQLVDCLVEINSSDSLKQAEGLLQDLESHGAGNRMARHLMQLKLVIGSEKLDEEKLRTTMSRVIHSAALNENVFKTVMRAIHRVKKASLVVACRTLEEFITERLLPDLTIDEQCEATVLTWLEKSCVTYVLFATSNSQEAEKDTNHWLQNIFAAIAQTMDGPFSPKAAHAIQALIWKAVDGGQPELCDLLRHSLFNSAGQVNKAKIGRRAMKTAMANNDFNAARDSFYEMPSVVQNESISRYLAFKLALVSKDYELATESLSVILKQADQDATFLYACVLEAQQSQFRSLAVAALQAIIDKAPSIVHMPSLLRCTAKLMIGELENQERPLEEVMAETIRIFEHAASGRQTLDAGNNEQWRAEIHWWTKNAYNLALYYCGKIQPEQLVRMLRVCIKLIAFHPDDDGPMHKDGLKRRQMLCHFIAASALVVLGRTHPEGSEDSLQSYLEARKDVERFTSIQAKIGDQVQDKNGEEEKTTQQRLLEMFKLDLECILNLQHWDQIDAALKACLNLKTVDRWDKLADIVLIAQRKISTLETDGPIHTRLTEVLQRAINDTWKKEKDMVKCSRWLRISFASELNEGNTVFALTLLSQATGMAKKGYEGKTDAFPDAELQWLATTAFNKAVDFLAQGEMNDCRPWIDGALELARYSVDNGALHANLTAKKHLFDERMKARAE